MRNATHSDLLTLAVGLAFVIQGCTTTLVKDEVRKNVTDVSHCAGSEWADNSSLAVLPIPVVAFFVPHVDMNEIEAEEYLRRCGESTQTVNREVEVSRVACIPAGLTRIISLGIWQWCPVRVTWEADVQQ
jgi:hypothetical protein